uniref:C2H2-type domain-containing protein n=1 Tax=Bionectria ochroleuca TaxID=29856 RepID=A0A8H7N576_BIOOC
MENDTPTSSPSGSETKARALYTCPYEGCGKAFKDLKTHLLTHSTERPEKCPMRNCEYYRKGFARKYDRNRHVLTHFKGTIICGVCPDGEDSNNITFYRPDTFKKHLTTAHGAELAASAPGKAAGQPSSAALSPTRCSICAYTLPSVHALFEHLEDCVLQTLQHEDEGEVINTMRLAEVEDDAEVLATLARNNLSLKPLGLENDSDSDASDDNTEPTPSDIVVASSSRRKKKGVSHGIQKQRGSGRSQGGPSNIKFRSRKVSGKAYPPSWGFNPSVMTIRHRVLAVFDGQRRLVKDDMVLSNTEEVRLKLSDERYYTTDLDVQTLKRAEAFHNATEEEKGPWIPKNQAADTDEAGSEGHGQEQEAL